jgi:flavin reductase (DIM6/NTAB) family NADH-FMN oxidoreductase RutF
MEGRATKPHRPVVDPQAAQRSALRSCLGRFATGVAVITFDSEHDRHGITVNSFTSVSLDPPLVLVSVDRRARSHDLLHDRAFTVNVLGAEQEGLARRFAGGSDTEPHWIESDQAPRLAGVLAHLECQPWRAYDGGDHTLFLGEVVGFDFRDGDALAYHTSRFTTVAEELLGHEHLI